MPGDHQVRHRHRRHQAERGPGEPQRPVQVDGRAQSDQVPAQQQRAGADGEQRHRRGAVEVSHHRIERVAARGRRVSQPVHDGGHGHGHQQERGQRPDRRRARPQPGQLQRQRGRCHGDDPGAHHRGVPVRPEVGEHLARVLQVAQQPASRGPAGHRTAVGTGVGGGSRAGRREQLCHAIHAARSERPPVAVAALQGYKQTL